jgi:hypothetical protein
LAWLRRGVVRKDCTRVTVEQATQRVGPLRKNLWIHHEGKCGTKDLGGKRPPYLRKKRTTTNGIEGWSSGHQSHLGCEGTLKMILYAIFRWKIAKQVVATSSRLQKIRKWSLWRGRLPPKRKKKLWIQEEPVMWEHWPLHELQPPLLCVCVCVCERERERM